MAQEDICFNKGNIKFNFRVACIIENNGRFLLHRRKTDSFWNLPGGRVKLGELCEEAIKREIKEEISCDCRVEQVVKVSENFFEVENTTFHEILVIFKAALLDEFEVEGAENELVFEWFPKEELHSLSIKPEFTKKILLESKYDMEWMVNDEIVKCSQG